MYLFRILFVFSFQSEINMLELYINQYLCPLINCILILLEQSVVRSEVDLLSPQCFLRMVWLMPSIAAVLAFWWSGPLSWKGFCEMRNPSILIEALLQTGSIRKHEWNCSSAGHDFNCIKPFNRINYANELILTHFQLIYLWWVNHKSSVNRNHITAI